MKTRLLFQNPGIPTTTDQGAVLVAPAVRRPGPRVLTSRAIVASACPAVVTCTPSAAPPRDHVRALRGPALRSRGRPPARPPPAARGSWRATVKGVWRPPGRKPRGAADRACDSVSPARSAGLMAAAAMAEQESARNGARNRGGVQRVEGKLRASVEKGDYYEAHQMYRTLFFR